MSVNTQQKAYLTNMAIRILRDYLKKINSPTQLQNVVEYLNSNCFQAYGFRPLDEKTIEIALTSA